MDPHAPLELRTSAPVPTITHRPPTVLGFPPRRAEGEKDPAVDLESEPSPPHVGEGDPFGDEGSHDIKFKTMTWW